MHRSLFTLDGKLADGTAAARRNPFDVTSAHGDAGDGPSRAVVRQRDFEAVACGVQLVIGALMVALDHAAQFAYGLAVPVTVPGGAT